LEKRGFVWKTNDTTKRHIILAEEKEEKEEAEEVALKEPLVLYLAPIFPPRPRRFDP
jgi:hypothetical protein